jgi:hypothetical protein
MLHNIINDVSPDIMIMISDHDSYMILNSSDVVYIMTYIYIHLQGWWLIPDCWQAQGHC